MHSDEAAELVERIARDMTHGTGDRVVLGEWVEGGGGYVQEAIENGGRYFETPPGLYDSLGENRAELAWATNEQFLRNQLLSGVDIDFLGDVEKAYRTLPRHRSLWSELDFLYTHAEDFGYKLIGNSWVKVP